MASNLEADVPLQQMAEVQLMGKDKPTAPEGKSRRALKVINNFPMVESGSQQTMHRSFAAQYACMVAAANKQAADLAKKDSRAGNDENVAKGNSPSISNKPEYTNRSPCKAGRAGPEAPKGSHGTRRKVRTLTSVLTARSRVSCGVHDIDASDAGNEFAHVDYVEDLYQFYKLAEKLNQPSDYMDFQVEINAEMRAIVADWLIQVHDKFQLMPETLYLTFHVLDRYLSLEMVQRKELQLVGVSSMLIACKYEETWAPQVDELVHICGKAFDRKKILEMEKGILNKLEWSLTVPTMYVFLARFVKAALGDREVSMCKVCCCYFLQKSFSFTATSSADGADGVLLFGVGIDALLYGSA